VGACAWHIVAIDFTNALKNITDYQACKKFFVDKLVNSTTCPNEWEQHFRVACQKWPAASEYLNELYRVKQRWGSAWRLDHFTQGKQASSAVEGSFHGFKEWIGGEPRSFAGVVQQHIQKDMNKIAEERQAVNECGKDISHNVTEKFAETNIKAQNYVACALEVSQVQICDDITGQWSVSRRSVHDETNRRPPRIVTERNGKKECSCKEDKNSGQPCPHIQCVVNGAYNLNQFHPHWRRTASVEIAQVVDTVTPSNAPEASEEAEERPNNNGNSSNLDDCPSIEEPEIDRFSTGLSASDSRTIAQELQGSFITHLSHLSAVPPPGQTQATAISTVVLKSRIQSKKKSGLSGPQKFNKLNDIGRSIANTASQESDEIYTKVLSVMNYIKANMQRSGEEELKEAAAEYVGVKRNNLHLDSVLAPAQRKSAGATSTKRKKSSAESNSFGKTSSKSCSICRGMGHQKSACPAIRRFGLRLTKARYTECMATLPELSEAGGNTLDPVVPTDTFGVQVRGQVNDSRGEPICKCALITQQFDFKQLENKEAIYWISRAVIDKWSNSGSSSTKTRPLDASQVRRAGRLSCTQHARCHDVLTCSKARACPLLDALQVRRAGRFVHARCHDVLTFSTAMTRPLDASQVRRAGRLSCTQHARCHDVLTCSKARTRPLLDASQVRRAGTLAARCGEESSYSKGRRMRESGLDHSHLRLRVHIGRRAVVAGRRHGRLVTLGGGEGAGRRRTITSYFVAIASVCSLLSGGMSGMRMSNESPPRSGIIGQKSDLGPSLPR
ncbi:hypothetical protein THAOC_31349, partial [Thalassiosira oceanica]